MADNNLLLGSNPKNVTELKKVLENIIQREIVYSNYKDNPQKIMLGHRIVDTLKKIQEKWPKQLINLSSYTPFVINDKTPSWQVDLWEPFLAPNLELTIDNFHDLVWLVLKSRQIGFSYVMFRLQVALALSLPNCKCLLGAKDKTWISSIVDNISPAVLPYQEMALSEKNTLSRDFGIQAKSYGFNKASLIYQFPEDSLIKLLGIDTISDKNRGLGNVSIISVDEAAYVENASIITTVLKPMLNFNQGSFIFGSTPNGDNWFKKYVDDCRSNTSTRFRINQYDLYTCGIYTEAEADKILWNSYEDYLRINATMEPIEAILLIAQEYLYHFNNYGKKKKYYPAFANDPGKYTYMGRSLDYSNSSNFEVFVSIDYGGTSDPMAVLFVAVDRAGNFLVFDELNLYDSGIKECVDAISAKIKMWNIKPRAYYIDKSAHNKSIMTDKNSSIKISDIFFRYGLMTTPVKKMNKVVRIDIVNEFMRVYPNNKHPITGFNPSPRLFISDSCVALIKQMATLEMEINSTGKASQKFNNAKKDDLSDCLLYVISELSGYFVKTLRTTGDAHMGTAIMNRTMQRPNQLMNGLKGVPTYQNKPAYKPKVTRFA